MGEWNGNEPLRVRFGQTPEQRHPAHARIDENSDRPDFEECEDQRDKVDSGRDQERQSGALPDPQCGKPAAIRLLSSSNSRKVTVR